MAPRKRSAAAQPAGELELIEWIRGQAAMPRGVAIGPGDDCAALRLRPGELCVVTTDSVIAGVHYDPGTASPERIGRKSAARSLSDLAAMAARPVAIVCAAQFPRSTDMAYAKAIIKGQMEVCRRCGAALAGGDVAVSDGPLSLNVTAIGAARAGRLALRSGARPGDALCVTGELGGSILGHHLDFTPRLKEAQWLRRHAALHAMIDISDGLARDAGRLAAESGAGVVIDPARLPLSAAAAEMSRRTGKPAVYHALNDGEDYELLFAVAPRTAQALTARRGAPCRVTTIGQVVAERGLWILDARGRRRRLAPGGWTYAFGKG
ncbi:MAG TPA: thiamine-phosphate kinase [Candidatus Brocadiia bacterium]|nr:thiamine-phosphate kinase [Candidatus Brocadiia bacterium]